MQKGKEIIVSVIIPFFNMEKYLEQTLQSVFNSQYENFEVILVDDGSTDGSLQIAKKYLKLYPNTQLFLQKNQGVSHARNNGIKNAQGKYILPVDSDDLITPEYISEAVKILENDQDVKVVTSEGEFFDGKTGRRKLPDFDLSLLARKNILHITALYRKSDWERIGGYCVDLKGREDWDLWISILKDGGKAVKLPFVGYYYRIRKNSKRIRTRKYKDETTMILNQRHKKFFNQVLDGPLRKRRSLSKPMNRIFKFLGLKISSLF